MPPINRRERRASLMDPLPTDVDEDLDYPVLRPSPSSQPIVVLDRLRPDARGAGSEDDLLESPLAAVPRDAPSQLAVHAQVQDGSRLVRTADRVGQTAFRLTQKTAAYAKTATTQYTARNAATEAPLVVSPDVRVGIDRFVAASATASKISQKSLQFAGRQAERAAELAARRLSNGDRVAGATGPIVANQRFKDATRAVQVLASAFEKSGEHLLGTLNDSYDTIVYHRYGAEAAIASKQMLTAGASVVKVVSSTRGIPVLLIKNAGKGALRVHLKNGREIVLEDGQQANGYIERTDEGDLIVLDDSVVEVTRS